MTDIHAAVEASRKILDADVYCGTFQPKAVSAALLAVLADPTVLLKPPEWEMDRDGTWIWHAPFGDYYVAFGRWWREHHRGYHDLDSDSAAQSACWADYRERMRGAFHP